MAILFLMRDGFSEIKFLPALQTHKSPDLIAKREQSQVTIEVKSINPSDVEVQARQNGTPRGTGQPLTEEFFSKLQATLTNAAKQLATQQCDEKMIFLFVHFDNILNEYIENDLAQIKSWLSNHKMVADRYYIHTHSAFYYASSLSAPPHLIVWPPENDGVAATPERW